MGGQPQEILLYTEDKQYIYVPRQFGLTYCHSKHIEIDDQTSSGLEAKFPRIPTPRDYQSDVLLDIEEATGKYYDFLFRAHTGWGKTVGALIVAARVGVTTLVVVDQDNLKEQWLDALKEHFGLTIENGGVGIIQGKKCDYEHPVVIAMVHTLSQKTFKQEVYDYFGFVIVDEVHTAGAPTFSVFLRQFSATYRMGVSATPKRRDGLQKALDFNLGPVRVAADKEHDESAVYFVRNPSLYSWYGNISPKVGRILTEIAEDGARNLLCAEIAMLLWETGRDVLLLSDRIEQLNDVNALLYYMGIDEREIGLYCGDYRTYRYAKNPTPSRQPQGLVKHEETGKYEYTPVSLQLISKKASKAMRATAREASIMSATYGMCAKGFDDPRRKAGLDLTPRSRAEQVHGRILRIMPGTRPPIWATILDEHNFRLVFAFAQRVQEYQKSNGRMYEWGEDGELTECHVGTLLKNCFGEVKRLKEMRIEQNASGKHTLVTKRSEIQQLVQRVKGTEAKTRPAPVARRRA